MVSAPTERSGEGQAREESRPARGAAAYHGGESDTAGSLNQVSTRTYIVLAALTGLVILAAFAVQLART